MAVVVVVADCLHDSTSFVQTTDLLPGPTVALAASSPTAVAADYSLSTGGSGQTAGWCADSTSWTVTAAASRTIGQQRRKMVD